MCPEKATDTLSHKAIMSVVLILCTNTNVGQCRTPIGKVSIYAPF